MTSLARRQWKRAIANRLGVTQLEDRVNPDANYFSLAGGNFTQDWSNTGLITTNDDWSGVPSIIGYRGDGLTGGTGTDPQTILAESTVINVIANQTAPNSLSTGGVAEFELTNPSVALNGSGTADAPYVQFFMNSTGRENVRITYNVRDLDSSVDDSTQQVALQYRFGETGNFVNVSAGYINDATEKDTATKVTNVDVTLPASTANQAKLQIRVITSNAVGNDEWIGIDDIVISSTAIGSANNPPVITSNGGGATADIPVPENSTDVTIVTATDADAGDTITFSISGTDAALFSINSSSGFLSFKNLPNFEAPADANTDNKYEVTVKASDGTDFDTQAITVTVTDRNDSPIITSNGGGETASIPVAEGMTAVTTVTATDEDAGAVITYTITGTDAGLFSIGSGSGVLAFITAPDFEAPADANADNKYEVTVKASDGTDFDTQAITITVTDLNDSAPVIISNGGGDTANASIAENTKAVTTVVATDKDAGTTITYSLSGGADKARFTIDSGTGALAFAAAPNFEGPTDSDLNNVYEVTVMASDGTLFDTQAISVMVTDANETPPVITSDGGGATAAINLLENMTMVTTVQATDADASDNITYSLSGGVDKARFAIDTLTGALTFVTAPNFEAPNDADTNNKYEVTVRASDGTFFDTQDIIVTIVNVDEAPVFVSDGGGTTTSISRFENVINVTVAMAVDPEGKTPITYGVAGGADAALFFLDTVTGNLSFLTAPDFENPSDANLDNIYEITLSATEGTTLGTQAISITINNVNEAPIFTVGSNQTVNEDAGAQSVIGFITGIAVGPTGDLGTTVTFDVSNTNNGLFTVQPTIDASGKLTFTAGPNLSGSAKVTVIAMDNGGTDNGGVDTSDPQFFTISVIGVNDQPDFSIGGNVIVNEDSGTKTSTNYLTSVIAGPPDEAGSQTTTTFVTNDSNALFATQPSIDAAGTLTFTPAANANGLATVTVKVQDNGGTSNGGIDSRTQTFTITVNEVNDAPSFVIGANQTVNEDAGAQSVSAFASAISAGPSNESTQTVSFLVSNDNNTLFAVQPSIDATGKLTYTLAPDAFGSAKVSVQAKDDGGTDFGGVDTSTAQTFTITVNGVNDAPMYTIGADPDVNEDTGAQSLAGFLSALAAGPANESTQTLTIALANDNTSLFAVQPTIDLTGQLSFTPADDANGSALVTVTVTDSGGTAFGGVNKTVQTFTVTVNAVNDEPSFATTGNTFTTINEGLQAVSGFVTGISAGPSNESSQIVTFIVTNDNNALFAVQPAIDVNGQLTYTPASDATGIANVTIVAMDDGGTLFGGDDTSDPQMVTITIFDKNIAPSFLVGASQNVNEDSGANSIPSFLTNISAGPPIESGQTVSFLVSNDNTSLFTVQPAIDSTGKLTFTLAPDAFGSATVTVFAKDDGGTLNGGADTSAPQTFSILVNAVNDAPTFTVGGNQTANEDAGVQTVSGFATGITSGAANETTQNVQFLVSSDNPSLFVGSPTIDANGNLTYTPALNSFGSAIITVVAKDNGGTAFGGTDTSSEQKFTITINPVNDAPTFTIAGDQTVLEDVGPQSIAFLTNLAAGPANESTQTVGLTVNSTNPGLFAVLPTIDASGKLIYTPATDANGTSTVTVTATDNGGTANEGVDTSVQTFTISVTAVNDDPNFVVTSKIAVNEDAGPQSVPNFAFNITAGPANEAGQPLSFALTPVTTAGDLSFTQAPAIDATGTLTFTTAPDTFGTATVTVVLSDGTGGTATQNFALTVDAVNDPPTSTVLVPNPPLGGIGPQTVPNVLALTSGAGNEADPLQVTVSVASTTGKLNFTQAPVIDANGTLTYAAERNSIGTAKLAVTVSDGTDATSVQFVTISVDSTGPTEIVGYPEFAVGSDLGLTYVSFHNPDMSERFFSPAFPGTEFGARVSSADFSRDGIADLVIGSGVGRSTLVQVIDAVTQKSLFSIMPFESGFTGGVYVASGDIDGDGIADLVITPDEGGGPRVRVFGGANFELIADFFGIDDANFRGGARAALGDLNGDGKADLVVAAGFGGGPRIAGFDGASLVSGQSVKLFNDFFAFEQTLRNGVFVAIGDVDGDGSSEIIAGGGPGGGPRVTAFNGSLLQSSGGAFLTPVFNFFAGDQANRGGIRIAVKDLDNDNRADLVVGSGTGAGSRVTAYLATALTASGDPESVFAFDAFEGFTGGVFVG